MPGFFLPQKEPIITWYLSTFPVKHREEENLLCLHDSMFPRLDLFLNYYYLIQYNVKCYKKSDDASLFKPGDLSSQETLLSYFGDN